ncbi:MAG: cytochrome c oxidase assembly protein [Acidimicrobiia bacterium]|nr:cytochrome c oxidase assembly protein [Acidimicrobiia bacterium]
MSGRHARKWLVAGLIVLAVAIIGLERPSETSFTWHMIQHMLLTVVAAPLLALGAPAVLPRLPDRWQHMAASVTGSSWVAWMVVALTLQSAAMLLWHLPPAFQAAVEHDPLHGLEHFTMLATAIFFWWVVFSAGSDRVAVAIVALFFATGVCSALGAGLTLASHTWYPAYRSSSDQAMGGVIMWAVVGTAYLVGAVILFFKWLARLERTSPGELVTG